MSIKRKNLVYLLLLFIILYSLHFLIIEVQQDDLNFASMPTKYTLMEFMKNRYFGWSGRIFPDFMLYTLLHRYLWVWRIINPILFLVMGYGIVRIFKKEVTFFELLAAILTIGYFNQNMISSGFFWISGSINYLWPISLGLIGMIPYADVIFRKEKTNLRAFFLFFPAAILASIGDEQVTLCLVSFAILTHLFLFLQKQKQDPKLLITTFFIILGAGILLGAPGNHVRYLREVQHWFPTFDQLSLKDHLYVGVIWIYTKIFNDMQGLLLLVSILMLLLNFKQKNIWRNIPFLIFLIQIIIILASHIYGKGLSILYAFRAIQNFRISDSLLHFFHFQISFSFITALFPYIWWTIYGFALSYLLIKNSSKKYFTLFAVLAAICALIVMFFSPTIYASGSRVLDVSAVLLTAINIHLLLRYKLLNNRIFILLYSVIPIINLLSFILKWVMNGYFVQL